MSGWRFLVTTLAIGCLVGGLAGLLMEETSLPRMMATAALAALASGFWVQRMCKKVQRRMQKHQNLSNREFRMVKLSQVFLFNTLHNISAWLDIEPDRARRTIELLAEYIRALMEVSQAPRTLLSHELKCIDLYLAVERARFGERFTVDYDIQNDCYKVSVPSLILHPLIDAALRYGVEAHEESTQLTLRGTCSGRTLELEIIDITESVPVEEDGNPRESFFEHVWEELNEQYAGRASLETTALVPTGYRVQLTLPVDPSS